MELSVVIPTLNGRQRLMACLDAVATHLPSAEVIVINGPSVDGTTGMIKTRKDVDVLLETPTRNPTVARNAGAVAATGETIAFLRHDRLIDSQWVRGLEAAMADGAAAVSGPTRGKHTGMTVNPENVIIDREALEAMDGFDEYLTTAGVADLWIRLRKRDFTTVYSGHVAVTQAYGTDGGQPDEDWNRQPGALGYVLGKNGVVHTQAALSIRPQELFRHPQAIPRKSQEFIRGLKDGLTARYTGDETTNPNGLSATHNRHIKHFDWR